VPWFQFLVGEINITIVIMWRERDYNCNNVAWREITIVIAINYSVLNEGRRQTFPLSMSLAQKPHNISN
jgi:hypothetical protein